MDFIQKECYNNSVCGKLFPILQEGKKTNMEYLYPSYYKDFSCTADRCPDTCCAGWGIAIDGKTLKKYREAEHKLGGFGNRLHNSVDWEDGSFYQTQKRCIFLNEDNLCDMVLEAGEEYLCKTCRRYPRHYEEFENLREVLLSLSCPEVARLILSQQEPVKYLYTEQEKGQEEEYEYFDFLLFTKLEDVREDLCSLFQDRSIPVEERMAFALALVHDVQTRIGRQELFEIDEVQQRCERADAWKKARRKWQSCLDKKTERRYLIHSTFHHFGQLEVLNPDFVSWIEEAEELLYHSLSEEDYESYRQQFLQQDEDLEVQMEQLLVYFLYSYFCGAVYDEDAFSKCKLILVHTMMIRELFLAHWILGRDGEGVLSLKEKVDVAHRYAREIEHSDPNLNLVEGFMKEKTTFDFWNLLTSILA